MSSVHSAQDGYVGIAEQVVQGTYVSPTDYMYVLDVDLNPDDSKLIPDPEIGTGRDITTVDQGAYGINGDLNCYIRQEAIGRLVKAALGGYSASGEQHGGEGDYLHVFTPIASGSLPWLSIERQLADTNHVFHNKDLKVNSMSIDVSPNEYAQATFGLVGISDEFSTTPGTPSFDETGLIVGNGVSLTMDGVAFSVKSLNLELNNNLVDDDYRLGTRFLGDISERRRELNLSMEVAFDDTQELYRKAFYGSAVATEAGYQIHSERCVITFDSREELSPSGGNYRWTIELEDVVFMAAPVPESGDDLIVIPLELLAIKSAGVSNIVRVSIWNGKTTY